MITREREERRREELIIELFDRYVDEFASRPIDHERDASRTCTMATFKNFLTCQCVAPDGRHPINNPCASCVMESKQYLLDIAWKIPFHSCDCERCLAREK